VVLNWEYSHTVEFDKKTYHVWCAPHRDGYTAYAATLQPTKKGVDYVKPIGSGHYTLLPEWAKASNKVASDWLRSHTRVKG
jgi:hypothetical protein